MSCNKNVPLKLKKFNLKKLDWSKFGGHQCVVKIGKRKKKFFFTYEDIYNKSEDVCLKKEESDISEDFESIPDLLSISSMEDDMEEKD